MKKIGFIDHYINEWHADNYPRMIAESSLGTEFEVALAWEETCPAGKKPIDAWCADIGIAKAESIEQVVEECDCLIVLSPDNPERHEDLSRLPLASGKPVYVDKPFADSLAAGKRMVELAKAHKTPLMSSSALRFDSTVDETLKMVEGKRVDFVTTRGPGQFGVYGIHQVEPLVAIMGTGATRVMQCGNEACKLMVIDYADGRRGAVNLVPNAPFQFMVSYGEGQMRAVNTMSDFFPRFIEAMLAFFQTGQQTFPIEQTLEITALLEAGGAALGKMDTWVSLEVRG